MITHEERNAIILRRTLSAVSWLYALWAGLLGATAWHLRTQAQLDPRLLLLHAGLLGLAGTMLWKPRRGAPACTLLASAGSIFFVVLDLRDHHVQAAWVDGAYAVIAGGLLYNSRRQA